MAGVVLVGIVVETTVVDTIDVGETVVDVSSSVVTGEPLVVDGATAGETVVMPGARVDVVGEAPDGMSARAVPIGRSVTRWRISTGVPNGTMSANLRTTALSTRMQPWLTLLPRRPG